MGRNCFCPTFSDEPWRCAAPTLALAACSAPSSYAHDCLDAGVNNLCRRRLRQAQSSCCLGAIQRKFYVRDCFSRGQRHIQETDDKDRPTGTILVPAASTSTHIELMRYSSSRDCGAGNDHLVQRRITRTEEEAKPIGRSCLQSIIPERNHHRMVGAIDRGRNTTAGQDDLFRAIDALFNRSQRHDAYDDEPDT